VHTGEITYDYWTCRRALEAIGRRPAFGFNWDPSHMMWQGIDPVGFTVEFADRMYHVECKDARVRPGAAAQVSWSATSPGGIRGAVGTSCPAVTATSRGRRTHFPALRHVRYDGPLSVEWEDAGMDRLHGAEEAQRYVRSLLWRLSRGVVRRRLQHERAMTLLRATRHAG
jgi:sugar phosphate isomerase/epimerase